MRVRFEVRDLPPGQWERVVRALWVMKLTSGPAGRELYGSGYVSYDEMVSKHMKASLNQPGGQAHFTPIFPIFHRLWLLEVENSLLSIDPQISGLPYWNSFKDGFAVFNNDFFGSAPVSEFDYAVRDGKFSYWRIPTADDPDVDQNISNGYGYIRAPLNPNRSPVLTRRMKSLCGVDFGLGEPAAWDFCAGRGPDFWDYQLCIDGSIHGRAHMTIGGSWQRPEQLASGAEDSNCAQWYGLITNTITSSESFRRRDLSSFVNSFVAEPSCFDCSCCTLDESPDDCLCRLSTTAEKEGCGPLWLKLQEIQHPPQLDYRARLTPREHIQIIGDFLDPVASANDPVFLFHHANVDRNFQKWLNAHLLRPDGTYTDLRSVNYLEYPRSSLVYGNNLNDPLGASNFHFSGLFGERANGDEELQPYSVREALERVYNQTVYIYDSLELNYAPDALAGLDSHHVSRTVSDSSPSNPSQGDRRAGYPDSGIPVGNAIVTPMLFTFILAGILSVVAVFISYLIKKRVA